MARSRPRINVGWYLTEWMDTLHVRQADMIERTGWSKTTASLLYNRQQDYNPELVKVAAEALNLAPFELLLPPDEAMAMRSFRQSARLVAEKDQTPFKGAPDDDEPLAKRSGGKG